MFHADCNNWESAKANLTFNDTIWFEILVSTLTIGELLRSWMSAVW